MDAIMYSEFSSDDLSTSKINKKIEKIIRKNGGYTVIPKEVKKMSRPYLGVKVVRAKKQKNKVVKFIGRKYELYVKDGKVSIRRHKHQYKPKGNWVNGENLDKIKFPCFCSYIDSENKKKIGMLNRYVKN